MPQFSANLGFLWAELSLPDAIRAAHRAGFDAVECHWPYETPTALVKAALEETGFEMLGLNTQRGNVDIGENGLAAVPGREAEARTFIDEAIAYADEIDATAIHVMAGNANGDSARASFIENLKYATSATKRTILIEPLNRHDAAGYFLKTTGQAAEIIKEVGTPNLKLMFDCYHVGRTEGDLLTRIQMLFPLVGHIQFASVPDRGSPDAGEVNFKWLFEKIDELGWERPLGAEFRPVGPTEDSLGWIEK